MVELSKHRRVHVTLLHYPTHVVDAEYSAHKLGWLLHRYNISRKAFAKVHKSLRNMTLVRSADVRRKANRPDPYSRQRATYGG